MGAQDEDQEPLKRLDVSRIVAVKVLVDDELGDVTQSSEDEINLVVDQIGRVVLEIVVEYKKKVQQLLEDVWCLRAEYKIGVSQSFDYEI